MPDSVTRWCTTMLWAPEVDDALQRRQEWEDRRAAGADEPMPDVPVATMQFRCVGGVGHDGEHEINTEELAQWRQLVLDRTAAPAPPKPEAPTIAEPEPEPEDENAEASA